MVTDFFATTVDDWDDPGGMLHAYLIPDAAMKDRLASASAALAAPGLHAFLAPQPRAALHVTVQRFPFLVVELDAERLTDLAERATRSTSSLAPVLLDFGAPTPAAASVLVRAEPDARWQALVSAVRDSASAALGPDARRYEPPADPHITLAYATATGEGAAIRSALESHTGAASPLGEAVFSEVAWCAVHQNRSEGTYTFETLFSTPLGS